MKEIKEYILEELQKEYSFKKDADIDELNYIEEGYMDSLGLIQFIAELESEFHIEFSEDEINSSEFRVVGSLTAMIERKVKEA